MSKKKPVIKITNEPATFTVMWTDRSGVDRKFTSTDKAEVEAKYYELYLKYVNREILELQIRSDF